MVARNSNSTRTILWLSAVTSALAYGITDFHHHSPMATTAAATSSSRLMAMTQRDPIRMPSQTPMVPYKVRTGSAIYFSCIAGVY
jgi:hypothetical protein